jgi:hypothetical protein
MISMCEDDHRSCSNFDRALEAVEIDGIRPSMQKTSNANEVDDFGGDFESARYLAA